MSRDALHGRPTDSDVPFWHPLLDLVGLELVDWFMWMREFLLEDDSMLHAYKHIATRRYLYLHENGGRAFACVRQGRYREGHPRAALEEALAGWELTVVRGEDAG